MMIEVRASEAVPPAVGARVADGMGGHRVWTGDRYVDSVSPAGVKALAASSLDRSASLAQQALPFLDLSTWVGREPEERFFLVPGLIPGACVTSLYGDGGSGKTLLALWLMVCMASRYQSKWLDRTALGFKSVGLFAEDDGDEIVRRLMRVCAGAGVEFSHAAAHITALPGVGMDTIVASFTSEGELFFTPLMDALMAKVRETSSSLLVLDYAAAVFGGNEIDRAQVSAFMRGLNALAKASDIAILLLGHPSVDGMKGGRGTSGSTAWRNQSRAFLHLTVDDEQDDEEGRRLLTLKLSKANYAAAGWTCRLASDGRRFDLLEAGEGLKPKAKGSRLSPSQKVALKALRQAIDAASEASPGGPIPTSVRVVKLTLWREYAYRLEISGASEEARKKAFSRAVKELVAKDMVGVNDPLCWLVPEGDK